MEKLKKSSILRSLPVLVCLLFPSVSDARDGSENYRWEGLFLGGLNTNGWEAHGGVMWMPVPYVGLSATLGLDSEIHEFSDWWGNGIGDVLDYDFIDDRDYDYCTRLLLKPSVVFRSPALLRFESQDLGIHLFASPGFTLAVPASGSRNASWAYWNVSAGINATIDRYVFYLGYSYSNYSLLDGHPYTHHGIDLDNPGNTHSVWIGVGYKF